VLRPGQHGGAPHTALCEARRPSRGGQNSLSCTALHRRVYVSLTALHCTGTASHSEVTHRIAHCQHNTALPASGLRPFFPQKSAASLTKLMAALHRTLKLEVTHLSLQTFFRHYIEPTRKLVSHPASQPASQACHQLGGQNASQPMHYNITMIPLGGLCKPLSSSGFL
jgi:hypothetical protein